MSVFNGPQHRLMVVIRGQLADRTTFQQFAVLLLPRLESVAGHAFGWAHGRDGVRRIRQIERAVFGAEETAGSERLQFLRLADAFEPLADVDECRNGRIVRPTHACDPGTDV